MNCTYSANCKLKDSEHCSEACVRYTKLNYLFDMSYIPKNGLKPTVLYIDMPDPMPLSNNVDLESVWYKEPTASVQGGAPAVTAAAASGDVNAIMTQQAQQASFSTPASGAQPAQPAQPQTQQTAATQNFVQQANATSVMSTVGNNTVSPSPVAPQPVPSS